MTAADAVLAGAAGPSDAVAPFRFRALTRVGFDETDAQAVVYYGRYLPYFDRARVEYLRHLGLLASLPPGQEFVMRRSEQLYEAPARFDDPLEVFVRVARVGTTSCQDSYLVRHAVTGTLLTTAEQVLVLIDAATRRPAPIPAPWRATVDAFEGGRG